MVLAPGTPLPFRSAVLANFLTTAGVQALKGYLLTTCISVPLTSHNWPGTVEIGSGRRRKADVTENLDSNGGGAEKRRSTRVMHSATITVKGTDTLGQPFRESTKTVMVNCNGCQYQGIRYPAPSSSIMLEVRHQNPRRPPRVVPARVIWVRRPQAYRALYHVGIEFEVAGNVWDIDLPPADWFPCPEDEELVIPVASEENIAHPNQFVLSASVADVEHSGRALEASADAPILSARSTGTLLMPEERPAIGAGEDSMASQADRSASIMEMVRMFTAEAVAGEIVRIREFIDAELRGAIDKAFERLSERIASAPEARQVDPESPISETKVSETSDQIIEDSELRAPPSTGEPGEIRLTAKQRRAAKRAQKTQKTTF